MKRCNIGETYWKAIDQAIEKRDPDAIYNALRVYFTHKNGEPHFSQGQGNTPCTECFDARMSERYV